MFIFTIKLLIGVLSMILIAGPSSIVLAENDFTQEQLDTGRYSMAKPNGQGIGEGVSADGVSEVSSQYLEYLPKQSQSVTSSEVEAALLNGCNCVVFRMDDLQDYFVNTVQVAIMDEFTQRNEFLSIGPIFYIFGGDSTVVNPAVEGVGSGLFELFNHGWFHNDFSLEPLGNQTAHLQLGQDKAELLFGANTTFFVPPFNAFNNTTLDALVATDFETISSEGIVDMEPHYVADGTSNIVDSRGLYHLPSDVKFIDFGVEPPTRISNMQILDDIDTSIASRGYAVVTLHAQDHAQTFANGTYINAPNATLMDDIRAIIDGVNFKNYPIRTFGQVLAFEGTVSIDDVTLFEGDSGTTNFVFTVTRTDNSGALSVEFQTADDTATTADSDYIFHSGTLNFADGGPLTQTITVLVNGDDTIESDETFNVNLSNCTGCEITDAQGVGTITNDDTFGPPNDLDSDGIPDSVDPENIINSSITINTSHTVQNVIVQNEAVLTIPNGLSLNITSGSSITIQSGGVLIKSGGSLHVNS